MKRSLFVILLLTTGTFVGCGPAENALPARLPKALSSYKTITKLDVEKYNADFDHSFQLSDDSANRDAKSIIWLEKLDSVNKDSVVRTAAYYADELIVKLKAGVDKTRLNATIRNLKDNDGNTADVIDSVGSMGLILVRIKTTNNKTSELETWKKILMNSGVVEYTEPNVAVFLESNQFLVKYDNLQWHLSNNGVPSTGGGKFDADCDGLEALSKIKYSRVPKHTVVVGVIDSGIESTHDGLKGALWVNTKEVAGDNIDNDKNGLIDDVNGWNFASGNKDLQDYVGHGTHVAGIIAANPTAARNITGIAPEAKVIVAKYAENMSGSTFAIIKSIDYCVAQKATIINMSFGSYTHLQSLQDAVKRATDSNIIMVAATGNDARDIGKTPYYPACYLKVIAVAATSRYDEISSYSNYEYEGSPMNRYVKIAAPGDDILSTLHGQGQNRYGLMSGTSMATPVVSGAIALNKMLRPHEDLTQIMRRLLDGADIVPALVTKVHEAKRLNIYKSLHQPFETFDANGVPFRNQIVNGEARNVRYPYANSGDPQVDGKSYETAFKIASMKQLMNIRDEDLDKHFKLTNNISWHELRPVDREMINKKFEGTLYGEGFTIHNFDLQRAQGRVALFAETGKNAKIISLRFTGVNIKGHSPVGTIAATVDGSLLNDVQVEGVINGYRAAGGLAGMSIGATFTNCFFAGEVITTATEKETRGAGGLVGIATAGTSFTKCHVQAKLQGGTMGGVAGTMLNGTISQCYANVHINGTDSIGGLVARMTRSQVSDSYAEGIILNFRTIAGGTIGYLTLSTIEKTYSRVWVNGNSNAGVLLGRGHSFNVQNSYYLTTAGAAGAGGSPKTLDELKLMSTYQNWFNTGAGWTIPNDYTPALSHLPRSVVSLY